MDPAWNVIEFHPSDEVAGESLGSKEKRWVRHSEDESLWLVKSVRTREDGSLVADDWAEWVVHHLAESMGIPSAVVRPTLWEGQRAIASRSVLSSDDEQLILGNNLLYGRDPTYQLNTRRLNPGYTPIAIREALVPFGTSAAADIPGSASAFDQLAGYLVLDALCAARDRHHENWGVIVRQRGPRVLAPSFDHGNALGFAVPEESLPGYLAREGGVLKWCTKGRSHHVAGRPGLVDLAIESLGLCNPKVQSHWISHVEDFNLESVKNLLAAIPSDIMSEVRRTFILQLLQTNRRRLLNGYSASRRN